MIKSMTGFSKTELAEDGVNISIEIKSLNGKNLDINTRIPKSLSEHEIDIRNLIKKYIHRGSLSVNLMVDYDESDASFQFDLDKAATIANQIADLKKKLKIRDALKLEHILPLSANYMQKYDPMDDSSIWPHIEKGIENTLKELDKMRKKEGQNIQRDITKRINNFEKEVGEIQKLGENRIPEEQKKYKEKIARMFENDEIDEQRLQTEIVLMADKLDISEECVRLFSHLKQFNEYLKDRLPSGRKLNFLLQEMHREINTIGTKAANSNISIKVVNLKEEIERIREQVQNIE